MELLGLFLFGSLAVGVRGARPGARSPRWITLVVVTLVVGAAYLRLGTY